MGHGSLCGVLVLVDVDVGDAGQLLVGGRVAHLLLAELVARLDAHHCTEVGEGPLFGVVRAEPAIVEGLKGSFIMLEQDDQSRFPGNGLVEAEAHPPKVFREVGALFMIAFRLQEKVLLDAVVVTAFGVFFPPVGNVAVEGLSRVSESTVAQLDLIAFAIEDGEGRLEEELERMRIHFFYFRKILEIMILEEIGEKQLAQSAHLPGSGRPVQLCLHLIVGQGQTAEALGVVGGFVEVLEQFVGLEQSHERAVHVLDLVEVRAQVLQHGDTLGCLVLGILVDDGAEFILPPVEVEACPVGLLLAERLVGWTYAEPHGAVLVALHNVAEGIVGLGLAAGVDAEAGEGHEADLREFGHLLEVYVDGGDAVRLSHGVEGERAEGGVAPGGVVVDVGLKLRGEGGEEGAGVGEVESDVGAHVWRGFVKDVAHGGLVLLRGPVGGEFGLLGQHAVDVARSGVGVVDDLDVGNAGAAGLVLVVAAGGEGGAAERQQGGWQQADESVCFHDV